jgi:hypothetical protein
MPPQHVRVPRLHRAQLSALLRRQMSRELLVRSRNRFGNSAAGLRADLLQLFCHVVENRIYLAELLGSELELLPQMFTHPIRHVVAMSPGERATRMPRPSEKAGGKTGKKNEQQSDRETRFRSRDHWKTPFSIAVSASA